MWAKLSAKKKSIFLGASVASLMVIWVGIIAITQSSNSEISVDSNTGLRANLVATEAASAMIASSVDRTVNFEVGFDHTQESNLPADKSGNAVAKKSATALLKSLNAPQNVHLMGFGADNPEPSKGKYDWRSLDARVNLMRATTAKDKMVMTLCCAPKWMKGTKTDWDKDFEVAPKKAYFDDYAALAAKAAARYKDIKYFSVWNEMKGFWGYGGVGNRWGYEAYTDLYNQVFTAIKKVRPDAKIGGPYPNISVYAPNKVPKASTVKGAYGVVNQGELNVILYWLQHKKGGDFITMDGGVGSDEKGTLRTNGFAAGQEFADVAKYIRNLDASKYPGAKTLPLYWKEFYPATKGSSGQQAVAIATSNVIAAGLGGINKMFFWEPEGLSNGTHPDNVVSVWTESSKSGGGKATSFYNALKLLHTEFPVGTQLYKVTTKGNLTVLASKTKLFLLSKTKNNLTVTIGAKKVSLKPYEVKVVVR